MLGYQQLFSRRLCLTFIFACVYDLFFELLWRLVRTCCNSHPLVCFVQRRHQSGELRIGTRLPPLLAVGRAIFGEAEARTRSPGISTGVHHRRIGKWGGFRRFQQSRAAAIAKISVGSSALEPVGTASARIGNPVAYALLRVVVCSTSVP